MPIIFNKIILSGKFNKKYNLMFSLFYFCPRALVMSLMLSPSQYESETPDLGQHSIAELYIFVSNVVFLSPLIKFQTTLNQHKNPNIRVSSLISVETIFSLTTTHNYIVHSTTILFIILMFLSK